MYYIQHNQMATFWNDETKVWQEKLTVICMGDYDECYKWSVISDLTNFEIKYLP